MRAGLAVPALACVVLAGCGVLRAPEPQEPAPVLQPAVPQPAATDAENLLLYYQHVRRIAHPDLAREHDAARLAYARSRTNYNRVRLALVLSLPNTAFSDEGRALELLDPVARNQNGPLHGLAFLLASHLQERRRLDASAQSLQQKLDALRSLERSMIERKR